MAITAQRLLTELGNRAWSGFNKDDMVWGNENAQTAQTELNIALRYLINLEDFPFKTSKQSLNAKKGKANYAAPEAAQISSIVDDKQNELAFIGAEKLDKTKTGKPDSFYMTYANPDCSINLYPTPDNDYAYTVNYSSYYPVMDSNYNLQFELLEATDILNLPESLEFLFMDCLILRTMAQNNKDQEDENYVPMLNEFKEHWDLFKAKSQPVKKATFLRM